MKHTILALDTATSSCSVAIVKGTALLSELTVVNRQTHAKHLMGMIDTILGLSKITLSDIDGFAVSKGPGSFTGLRIGIASAKGLAMASGKPIVGISTLDALADQSGGRSPLVCSLLDARRGEVYFSRYRWRNDIVEKELPEGLATPEEIIGNCHESCLFIGSGAVVYRDLLMEKLGSRACFPPEINHTIRASTLARLGMERLKTGQIDDVATFVPVYLRKSDAEIHRKPPHK